MFAKIKDGKIIKYPYEWNEIRADHSNISFPPEVSEEFLATLFIVVVQPTPRPTTTYLQNAVQITPVKNQYNKWVQTWEIVDATEEQIQARLDFQWNVVRQQRNDILTASDWTQSRDVHLANDEAWTAYRQDLRNITETYSNPFDVVFPEAPEEIWE